MAIKELKAQFKDLNKTQQKFIIYVVFIKMTIILLGIALLILAWKYFMH